MKKAYDLFDIIREIFGLPENERVEGTRESRKELISILSTLTGRGGIVLILRNGFSLTLQDIAATFGITQERVRQIEAKAFRQLKHPPKKKLLERFIPVAYRRNSERQSKLDKNSIEMLQISYRAYRCLRLAGIKNKSQIKAKSDREMFKIKGLGWKTLKEIRSAIK